MNKSRIEAFSDGVIAIIITIMVLELKIPHGTSFSILEPLIPVFLSYVLSFIFIGIYWGNHHHLLHTVKQVNSKIIWANLHLLFWLSLVPFATAFMGENHFEGVTVAVYAILASICGMAYYLLLKLISAEHSDDSPLLLPLKKQEQKGKISLVLYLSAIPISFYLPLISALLFVAVSILWWIPDKNIEKSLRK